MSRRRDLHRKTRTLLPRTARSNHARSSQAARRGVILVIVLVVVAALSFSAYAFSELMLVHREATVFSGRQIQARMLVDSATDTVRWFLMQDAQTQLDAGGLYDNPYRLRGVTVLPDEDPNGRGSFTLVAPSLDSQGNLAGVRFGLEDESTRLNLNVLPLADQLQEGAGRGLLMALPGMSEDIADAILDWIDEDDEPREYGAEVDYYSSLSPPYQPKNGKLNTVEELLLVRGVTAQLLFGNDMNRNGMLDPHEIADPLAGSATTNPLATSATAANTTSTVLSRGWSAYLTLYSMESNVNAEGQQRIYLNTEDMQQLYDELSTVLDNQQWINFIIAFRQNGPYEGDEDGDSQVTGELDLSQPAQTPISQVLDLIGKKVQVRFQGSEEEVILESPFASDLGAMLAYLPVLMDNVTVNPEATIPGRINVNQCSREVLLGIPFLEEEEVDQILQLRGEPQDQAESRNHETWLLTEGVLFDDQGQPDIERMKQLMPFLCGGGDVYRSQLVGYFQGGGASARVEAVFDATNPQVRILFWRDMSHLGRGYSLETLGVDLTNQMP